MIRASFVAASLLFIGLAAAHAVHADHAPQAWRLFHLPAGDGLQECHPPDDTSGCSVSIPAGGPSPAAPFTLIESAIQAVETGANSTTEQAAATSPPLLLKDLTEHLPSPGIPTARPPSGLGGAPSPALDIPLSVPSLLHGELAAANATETDSGSQSFPHVAAVSEDSTGGRWPLTDDGPTSATQTPATVLETLAHDPPPGIQTKPNHEATAAISMEPSVQTANLFAPTLLGAGANALQIALALFLSLVLAAPVLFLYRRLTREDAVSSQRIRVLALISDRPGLQMADLARALGVHYTTAAHHVRRLRELFLVRVARDGRRVLVFPAERGSMEDLLAEAVAARGMNQALLRTIAWRPGATQRELAVRLGVTQAAVSRRLQTLRAHGLVDRAEGERRPGHRITLKGTITLVRLRSHPS